MEREKKLEVFNRLSACTFEGVPGVAHFSGEGKGLTVGITVCTHGNEPAGLAAADYIFSYFEKNPLKIGEVFLVLNNIEATKRYLHAKTDEERSRTRFVDINLNRLPEDMFNDSNETRYEILRARELIPIWRRFTVGLDIHSTSQDAEPMLISVGKLKNIDHLSGFPVQKLISNIDKVMQDRAVAEFFGSEESEAYGLECGGHEQSSSFALAVHCAQALLENVGMIDVVTVKTPQTIEEYVVREAVFFPNDSYTLTKIFKNFEPVMKGTVLATGNGSDIRASEDGHALFAPNTINPIYKNEEVLFLTDPVRTYSRQGQSKHQDTRLKT